MADFTYIPTFVFSEGSEFKNITTEFESGVKQFRAKWATPMRYFRLQFRAISQTTHDAIKAFFESKYGRQDSFTWEHPITLVEYTVRFTEDTFQSELVGYANYNLQLTLEIVK